MFTGFRLISLPLAATIGVATAWAQGPAPGRRSGTPAVEIGVGAGGLIVRTPDFEGAGVTSGTAEMRGTIRLTPRFAIDAGVSVAPGGRTCCSRQFEGFYTVQIRQRLPPGRGLFLTYGAAGYYARERFPEHRVPGPDGSPVIIPAYRHTIIESPLFTAFGAGFDQPVGSRASVRIDAQSLSVLWLPLGVRVSAGVSFGFGGRRGWTPAAIPASRAGASR